VAHGTSQSNSRFVANERAFVQDLQLDAHPGDGTRSKRPCYSGASMIQSAHVAQDDARLVTSRSTS